MTEPVPPPHKDLSKPLKTLSCTCCGRPFKGRQWWNQDTGHGLGPCCFTFATKGMTPAQIQERYGVLEVHIQTGKNAKP